MNVDYVQHWGNDLIVANAARVSFDKHSNWDEVSTYDGMEAEELRQKGWTLDSTDDMYGYSLVKLSDRDAKLVNSLARMGHTSCFEHMGATLKLKVPIFIARQIQRHRTFSYNEISRRYVDSPPEFFYPDMLRARAKDKKQGSTDTPADTTVDLAWYVGVAVGAYEKMLEDGVAPELARMILPQNMYTEFYMSGNLRAWEHFLKLRLDGHAQKEVQDVAKMVEEILQPLFPVSMKALMEN